jgi:uncharacterized protein YbcI
MTTEPRKAAETETPERPAYSRAAHISAQFVQLALRDLGRGPTRARTSINTNFVMVVLDDALTQAEKRLVEAGERDLIRRQRDALADLMRTEAIEIVESALERPVRSMLTDIDPDHGVAVIVFLLEPANESGIVTVAEVDRETVEDELASNTGV